MSLFNIVKSGLDFYYIRPNVEKCESGSGGPKIHIRLDPVPLSEPSTLHYLEARMKQIPRVLAASSAARSHDTPSDG